MHDGEDSNKFDCYTGRVVSAANCAAKTCDQTSDENACCVDPPACSTKFEISGGSDVPWRTV